MAVARALPAFAALSGASAASFGLLGPLAAAVGVAGALALLLLPFLGPMGLVAIAHLDGITLILDKRLPVSTFKLLTAATLAMILLMHRANPLLQGRPRPSTPLVMTMLFACWIVITHLISSDPSVGRSHTVGFLTTLLLTGIVAVSVHNMAQLRWMAFTIAVSGAISAVLVVLESKAGIKIVPAANPADVAAWQGEVRSAGASAYNPTTSAHLMLVSLCVSGALTLVDRQWRVIWMGCLVLCLGAIALMGARSALVGLGVVMLMVGWRYRKARAFPVVLISGLAAGLAALPFLPESMTERFQAVFDLFEGNTGDRTLLRRLSYNIIGFQLWSSSPIWGIGPGLFPSEYASPDFRWFPGRLPIPRQLHNTYMEVLTEMGVIGLGLFLAAVVGAARLALRAGRQVTEAGGFAWAFGIGLTGFLVASLFMPNEDNKYLWILVALCCRAAWITRRQVAG